MLHFSCPTGQGETGWDLGPLAEVLAPRQMSPQATKYKETMCAYWLSHCSRVQLFGTLWTVAYQACCRWDSPGKNTGVGCHVFLQGIFSTQELKLCLLHCGWILYHSTTSESPYRSQPYLLWEGTTQRSGTGRQRLLGTILEAGYHKCVGPFIVPYSAPVILPTTFGR